MILVHVLVENCKEAIPLEGGWDGMNLWEKALVCKVGVLDVLSQPVLCLVSNLSGQGKVGGLELGLEVVVLEVVAVTVVALHPAELTLLVVEVHPQFGLAEGSLLSVGRVIAALSDTVKQHLRGKTFQTDLAELV